MSFRPDIEGLRALAILPVVAFHAFPSALPGGFVGVDVFFVISGYLITSLLLHRLESGQYSVMSFYGARIRRIFPALFAMLALITPLAVFLLPPNGLWEFRRTLAATAVFASNVELYQRTGYFDTATDLVALLHTWSLAVEEQYYIFFPLLLATLFRRWPRGIGPVLLMLGLISLAVSISWLKVSPRLAFFSTVSRTFELMVGSILAVGFRGPRLPAQVYEALSAGGVALIALACLAFDQGTPFPGIAALLPCLGTALIIWTGGQANTIAGRLLSSHPLRWVGAMSFSLYLWHWPVLVFSRHWLLGRPNALQTCAAVALAAALAWASLRWVETPIRRASHTDRRLLVLGAACMIAALTAAMVLGQSTAWLRPLDSQSRQFLDAANEANPHRQTCHGTEVRVIAYVDRCRFGDLSSPPRTAVWADSHGAELALALGEEAGRRGQSVAQITASACPPVVGMPPDDRPRCAAHNESTLRALAADRDLERVIIVARYELYLSEEATAFEAGLRRSILGLTAAGKHVVLVDPVPTYDYPVPAALAALHERRQSVEVFGQTFDIYRQQQAKALSLLARLELIPGTSRLRTGERLCSSGRCTVVEDQYALYFDDNHLNMRGARELVRESRQLLLP
jgi:peptidoglycan/LPS O-acetylase OafA/YrhL